MEPDKYTATWVSHTSISDFLKCPRSYYLKHVYKDPSTGHKIKIMTPPLALGQAVHEVIEGLSVLPAEKRLDVSLVKRLEQSWDKVKGKKGGFVSGDIESKYRQRGEEMLRRVTKNPGPIINQAVKIKMNLPYYWLSEEEGIILCGKLDWLEYLPESNGVHIIDFKTGARDEDKDSLQLPIYLLLASNCQSRKVERASYWYLDRSDDLTPCSLPDYETANKKIIDIARKIKLARTLQKYACPYNGCNNCQDLERVVNQEGELVGQDEYGADIYILKSITMEDTSTIL